MAGGSGFQLTDLVFDNGQWIASGAGFTIAQAVVSDPGFIPIGSAGGQSLFEAEIVVTQATPAHLDVTLTAELAERVGFSFPSYSATLQVCRAGGPCEVDLTVTDAVADGAPQQVEIIDLLLDFSVPGTYTVSLEADASASAENDGASSSGTASWIVVLTLPEPHATLLGLVALLTLAVTQLLTKRPQIPGRPARN
jgi:hypothetical protein